jgi:hypothetical protein
VKLDEVAKRNLNQPFQDGELKYAEHDWFWQQGGRDCAFGQDLCGIKKHQP